MRQCLNCGKDTTNPKYCSKSCSAIMTNKLYPKRKRTRKCAREECDDIIKTWKHSLCSHHYDEYLKSKKDYYLNKTIGEYRNRPSVKDKHLSWKHAGVRCVGRTALKHLLKLPCVNCGYSLHVELCHIRSLSSFPDSALISEVNSEDNVIQLCRNCHWELDHGHLDINDIKRE